MHNRTSAIGRSAMSAERPSGALGPGDVAPSADYGFGERGGPAELAYSQSGDHTNAGPPDYSDYSQGYERSDAAGHGAEPTDWHRNAAVLMGFGAFATVTIGFIIYGLVVLLYGSHGGVPADATSLPPSASSPVPTPSPVSSPIPTTTLAPSPTTSAANVVPTTAASVPGTKTTVPSTEGPTNAATSTTIESSPAAVGPPPPEGPLVLVPPQPRLGP